MSQIINLRQRRKERNRMKDRQEAAENAAKFGRTKAEKLLDATRNEKAREHLDQHKLTPDSEYDQE